VDLFECLSCWQRFIVDDAGYGQGWRCPSDRGELALVIRGLPGTVDQIEGALSARLLAPTSRPAPVADQAPDRPPNHARRRHERQMERITSDYLAETAERGRETA
jgi:hypothetical protein